MSTTVAITGTPGDIAGDWDIPVTALPAAGITQIAGVIPLLRTAMDAVATMVPRTVGHAATPAGVITPITVVTDRDRMRTTETTRCRPTRADAQLRIRRAETTVTGHAFAATTAALHGQTSLRQSAAVTGLR